MIIRIAGTAALLGWAFYVHAASCVVDTPVATAKWVHDHDADLLPPKKKVKVALTNELFGLLKKEHECVKRTNEVCAIDADLWTNTQDGGIFGGVTFNESDSTAVTSTVLMKYKFALYEDGRDAKDLMTAIRLVKTSANACWVVDDIIGPEGLSLKKQLGQNE